MLLIKTFEYKVINTNEFSLIINIRHTCYSIIHYKKCVKSFIIVINKVCYYYELFVCLSSLAVVLRFNPLVGATLDKNIFNMDFFDYYSQEMN